MPGPLGSYIWLKQSVSLACKENIEEYLLTGFRPAVAVNNSVIICLKCLWDFTAECLGARVVWHLQDWRKGLAVPVVPDLLRHLSTSALLATLSLQVCAPTQNLIVHSFWLVWCLILFGIHHYLPGSYFFQWRSFLLSYLVSIASSKMLKLHRRKSCGEVDPTEIKTIARKNRLSDLQKKVMYILDSSCIKTENHWRAEEIKMGR